MPALTGDHSNRVTNTSAFMVYPDRTGALCANSHPGSYTGQDAQNGMLPVIQNSSGGGKSDVLTETYYKGAGTRNGKEREFIAIKVCGETADAT